MNNLKKKLEVKMANKYDNNTLLAWVDIIIAEASDELNDWETNFIADIEIKLRAGQTLSEKQIEKLEYIYAEKTK